MAPEMDAAPERPRRGITLLEAGLAAALLLGAGGFAFLRSNGRQEEARQAYYAAHPEELMGALRAAFGGLRDGMTPDQARKRLRSVAALEPWHLEGSECSYLDVIHPKREGMAMRLVFVNGKLSLAGSWVSQR